MYPNNNSHAQKTAISSEQFVACPIVEQNDAAAISINEEYIV